MHAAVGTLGPMYPLHTQGGWDFTGLSAHFEYMLNIPNTLRRVSRFLSDYPPAPGCGFCVVMEDLDELTEGHSNYDPEFAINVENLISNIFGNFDLDRFVVSALLATWLKDLPEIIANEGEDHLPLQYAVCKCDEANIERHHMLTISTQLRVWRSRKNEKSPRKNEKGTREREQTPTCWRARERER